MDFKGSESEQEDSLFKKNSFEFEDSNLQELDEFSYCGNSNNNLFLNKKTKSSKSSNNEIIYDLGKTKDTKNDLVVCNEIQFEIKGKIKGEKIDIGTQTRRPYYYDE